MTKAERSATTKALDDAVLAQLRAAQVRWAGQPTKTRQDCFDRLLAVLLREQGDNLKAIADDAGKSPFETASGEILPLLEAAHYLTRKGINVCETPSPLNVRVAPHKTHRILRKARGIVGVIAPSNFRFSIAGSEVLFALAAQNAVVLKPAPQAHAAATRFGQWLSAAGFPRELIHITDDDEQSGRALVESDVNYITFVGSTRAGRAVGARCAERGIPFRSELGGKASALVLASAPLRRSAAALCWGAFCHDGQVCAGVQRCFVDSAIIDAFVAQLHTELAHLPPRSAAGHRRARLDEVTSAFVQDAQAHGARVHFHEDGRAIVVFDDDNDARLGARVFREECFGPLLAVASTTRDDGAIAAVHAGPGDLIAYVFGERRAAERVAASLRVGTVMVNDVLWSYGMPEAPWRGVQKSGSGVTHGEAGLLDYMVQTHIVSPRAPLEAERDPYWYPHSEARLSSLLDGMRAIYGEGMERVTASGRALWHQTRAVLKMRKERRDESTVHEKEKS